MTPQTLGTIGRYVLLAFGTAACTNISDKPYLSDTDIIQAIDDIEGDLGISFNQEERETLRCALSSISNGDYNTFQKTVEMVTKAVKVEYGNYGPEIENLTPEQKVQMAVDIVTSPQFEAQMQEIKDISFQVGVKMEKCMRPDSVAATYAPKKRPQ